jgi:hypothetical protein
MPFALLCQQIRNGLDSPADCRSVGYILQLAQHNRSVATSGFAVRGGLRSIVKIAATGSIMARAQDAPGLAGIFTHSLLAPAGGARSSGEQITLIYGFKTNSNH